MLSLQYLQYTCELAHSVVFPLLTYLSTQRDCNSREGHRCLRNEKLHYVKTETEYGKLGKSCNENSAKSKNLVGLY